MQPKVNHTHLQILDTENYRVSLELLWLIPCLVKQTILHIVLLYLQISAINKDKMIAKSFVDLFTL